MVERVAGGRDSVAAFLHTFAHQLENGLVEFDGRQFDIGEDMEAWKDLAFDASGLTARIRVQMRVRPSELRQVAELERELSHPGD